MSPELKAAYIKAQAVSATIELEMMKTHNERSISNGREPEYTPEEFYKLIDKYGLSHNAIWHFVHN